MKVFAFLMACMSIVLVSIGLWLTSKQTEMRLMCFDAEGKYKFSAKEHEFRFEGNVIRASGKNGEYAIYPVEGSMCSIVKE